MKLSQSLIRRASLLLAKQRPPITIPFGAFAPDQADLGNPGSIIAKNVIPKHRSYGPLPSLSAQSAALQARCRGAIAAKDTAGNTYFYAGDATKLQQIRNNTVTDKSKAGGYSTGTSEVWEFAQFGNTLYATNYNDAVQSIAIGSAGNFADGIVSARKPKARHIGVIGDFLFLGNINDATDGVVPNMIWWSALNDGSDFTPSSSTQSDQQELPDGGWVQRIIGGAEYGIVFQERAIRRVTLSQSAAIFEITPVDRFRGTPIPNSVVPIGRWAPFISEEGFFIFNGVTSEPLGDGFVDKFFWDQFDSTYRDRVTASVDYLNKLLVWGFPGTGATAGMPNKMVLCHWPSKRWAYADIDHEILVRAETQSYSLDDLDSITTNIELLTPSLDDKAWQGGVYRFAAFDNNHKLAYFTGDNLAYQFDTAEQELSPGQKTYIQYARPLIDGGSPTVAVGYRHRQQDSVSYTNDIALSSEGKCNVHNKARYQRFRVKGSSGDDWTHALGVQVTPRPMGNR